MAKKLASSLAMEFEFRAEDLERLLSSKPKKVLFTVWLEQVTTDKGKKVGALRIKADTAAKSKGTKGGGAVFGEPKPPGFGI